MIKYNYMGYDIIKLGFWFTTTVMGKYYQGNKMSLAMTFINTELENLAKIKKPEDQFLLKIAI